MSPNPTLFPLVDKILQGRLEQTLRDWRAAGFSYEQMARRLHADHELDVNSATVRRWCLDLDIPAQSDGDAA